MSDTQYTGVLKLGAVLAVWMWLWVRWEARPNQRSFCSLFCQVERSIAINYSGFVIL